MELPEVGLWNVDWKRGELVSLVGRVSDCLINLNLDATSEKICVFDVRSWYLLLGAAANDRNIDISLQPWNCCTNRLLIKMILTHVIKGIYFIFYSFKTVHWLFGFLGLVVKSGRRLKSKTYM